MNLESRLLSKNSCIKFIGVSFSSHFIRIYRNPNCPSKMTNGKRLKRSGGVHKDLLFDLSDFYKFFMSSFFAFIKIARFGWLRGSQSTEITEINEGYEKKARIRSNKCFHIPNLQKTKVFLII